MSRKLSARIQGKGSDGLIYEVLEYRSVRTISYLSGQQEEFEGLPEYKLANGDHCNVLDDDRFQVVRTGLIISRTR